MDWSPVIAAGIGGILSLGGIVWLQYKTASKKDVEELHITFNSKMDRLLDEVSKRAFLEGHQAGSDEVYDLMNPVKKKLVDKIVPFDNDQNIEVSRKLLKKADETEKAKDAARDSLDSDPVKK